MIRFALIMHVSFIAMVDIVFGFSLITLSVVWWEFFRKDKPK